MENVIKNMNFKPLLEKVEYEKLDQPANQTTINMRVWDELKLERINSERVKVVLTRIVNPEPSCLLKAEIKMGLDIVVNPTAYDALPDNEAYFKESQVAKVLSMHIATVLAEITLHSPIGPMITAPVPQFPK